MALPATDNFNREDIGANWTTITSGQALNPNGTAVTGTSAGVRNGGWWNADTFADNQYSQIVLATIDSSNLAPGPTVRGASDAQSFYVVSASTTVVRYRKNVAATFTTLGSDISQAVSNGDTLKLSVSGTTLTASLNGTDLATRTDTALTSGAAGIFIYAVTGYADDWEGGDVGPRTWRQRTRTRSTSAMPMPQTSKGFPW